MQLIIKPTGKCNFNCTFCSAKYLDIKHSSTDVHPHIKEFIENNKPKNIIVTGGEPLLTSPEYYYNLHNISNCNISLTTNLKDFYNNPDKWKDLFNEPWMFIGTSFNYGSSRRWDPNTVYDEKMFLKVVDKFYKYTNKTSLNFIAVIDYDNEEFAIDHVYLAKKINGIVKLNNALEEGLQDHTYPRYKMYQIYLKIIELGLDKYESNCIDRRNNKCPKNLRFNCGSNIRCLYVDSDDKLHVGICDSMLSIGNEITSEKDIRNYIEPDEYISPKCAYCELFYLCNGCYMNRSAAKKDPKYCDEMKKIEVQIIKNGWLL